MGIAGLALRKHRLRLKQKTVICGLPFLRRKAKSLQICRRIIAWPAYRMAQKILLYASLPDEPDTRKIIVDALKRGKHVYLPAVMRNGELKIYRIRNFKRETIRGIFGVLEPRKLASNLGTIRDLDLAVVPGLAFDLKGRRLGRGKGYYDRFLSRNKKLYCAALGFKEHLVRAVPAGTRDRRMQVIVTEKAFHHVQ